MDGASRMFRVAAIALVLLVALTSSGWGYPRAPAPRPAPPIRLKAGTFVPARGETLPLPPRLTSPGYREGTRGYWLVQFEGPVRSEWKDALLDHGVEILAYVPDFAFKVRMTPAQSLLVRAQPHVSWVGIFQPGYKLTPDLPRGGKRLYRARVERGAGVDPVAAAIGRTGGRVIGRQGGVLLLLAEGTQLDSIAGVPDVASIEAYDLPEKHNEYGGGSIIGTESANARGYDGSTQTLAIADTGLGKGTAATAHPDIPATRIKAIYNWPGLDSDYCYNVVDDGARDVDSGHGTHVATSAVGGGDANGSGKGAAPAAKLVFQSVENWISLNRDCGYEISGGYFLTGIPIDLRLLFQQAYHAGARVHSNSWGSDMAGEYTYDSELADGFVWTHPDLAITFSAGNAGGDADGDGVIDNDSLGSPATAKNVISVGASENDRQGHWECDSTLAYADPAGAKCTGQNSIHPYGSFGDRFPANPVRDDPSAGNAGQMAAFSSRGPTDDGRIKPDLVAPGTWVLSGYSAMYREGVVNLSNGGEW